MKIPMHCGLCRARISDSEDFEAFGKHIVNCPEYPRPESSDVMTSQIEEAVARFINGHIDLPKLILLDTQAFNAFQESFYPKMRVPGQTPTKPRLKRMVLNSAPWGVDIAEVVTDQKILAVI